MKNKGLSDSLRERMLKAARDCFLEDDYHRVTTRLIAEQAGANVSMIYYYFGNKEGLYEEMVRDALMQLDGRMLASICRFSNLVKGYHDAMSARPEFPKVLLKVLTQQKGPSPSILELLEAVRIRRARAASPWRPDRPFPS